MSELVISLKNQGGHWQLWVSFTPSPSDTEPNRKAQSDRQPASVFTFPKK